MNHLNSFSESAKRAPHRDAAEDLNEARAAEFCPLNDAQMGVYLECTEKPDSLRYNIPVRARLPEKTDVARLIVAIETVCRKHPAFCVTFGTQNGDPVMRYRMREIPVEQVSAESFEQEYKRFLRPFDLENGPLCRFEIIHTPKERWLLFDVHHLIFDGSSQYQILTQIADVYAGGSCPDEQMTLFDQARTQTLPKNPEKLREYTEFFDQKFSDVDCDSKPLPDQLASGLPDTAGVLYFYADESFREQDVLRYTKAHGITENALFLGAFGYALSKCNGAPAGVFNTAHHGRLEPRLASTVGMFVKMLPVVYRFDENDTVENYLHTFFDDYQTLKRNDVISYTELASRYGVNTDVSFINQGNLLGGVPLEDGILFPENLHTGETVSDIELMLKKFGDRYNITVFYREALYTEAYVRGFVALFFRVVRGMMTAKTLGEIPLTDAESRQSLDRFNATEAEYGAEYTTVDLFRKQVEKTPDHICLVFRDKRFTYREVDRLTDNLAAALIERGVGREKVVGVLIPRCEYMLICSLGVLKAGGAYLPLDPTYPPERLNLMMRDSGAMLLIADPALVDVITEDFTGDRMLTDVIPTLPECTRELPSPAPEDLFVMLYTSGSTGVPKGVMYQHSNSFVTTQWVKKYFEIGEDSRVTAYASYGFDANTFDMYPAVTGGAQLHIIPDDIRLDFFALRDYFNENGITHTVMTTQVGRQFALLGGFTTLRHLSVAGEKLTPLDVPDGFRLYNLYGPSEGSVVTSAFCLDRRYQDIPIGKPVDNLKAYIVDQQGRLLPAGTVGELWIAGPHVTRGYLNRPEKTAEAYGKNPFCDRPDYARVYRTEDVVRILPDGNLQFVGRRDSQIKVRGFRVELTEIEEVIRRFPGIRDATVAAFDDAGDGKFLAAYVVSDDAVDVDALHAFIRAEKPPYMVPAVTLQLDAIPLNQNQKVNKKALPKPERKADHIVLPETDLQRRIYDLTAGILGHTAFGVDTDLFDAGLTSIGTLKLNVALGNAFQSPVRLDDIKRNATVRKLEALLSSAKQAKSYERLSDYPITQTQMGIYLSCSAEPDAVTYNMPLLLKLGRNVDTNRLADAIRTALNTHPYVKATLFADADGNIRAKRNDDAKPCVNVITCDGLPDAGDLVRPFRLLREPLYRIAICQSPDAAYLFMDFHHIVSDGTSERILLSDVSRAYAGETVTAERYTGFEAALDEQAARESSRYAEAKAYYDGIFAGCETNCLPPKAPEATQPDAASALRVCREVDSVRAYCERRKVTPNAFFNAAFGYALCHFGQFEDIVYTTIYNGRSDSRLASSVAMLVKTLPVLLHTGGSRIVADMIRETQEQLMNSMANDLYSFAEISGAYGIRSDIIFVYQGDDFTFDSLCGERAEICPVRLGTVKAPLTVNVSLRNGKYEIEAEYRRDLFNAALIDSLLDVFCLIVKGFTEKEKAEEISLLSESAERRLSEMNDTRTAFENIPVNRLVERHAASHPEKTAVICNGKMLTYGEMNRLANRMAHALVAYGVKKDTVVGLMLDRSVELSVTELAILKSGGAFLGLLPEYPDDRIAYCLQDAECPIVITTEAIKASRSDLFAQGKPYRALTVTELLENENDEDLNLDIPPDSLAYCIYTSGSTGNPKGVMIEHHNLANCAQPADFVYSLYHGKRGGEVVLALSSISFDMSIFDNLLFLAGGKTVCIATDEEIHNPAKLAKLMAEGDVDTVTATPSFLTNILSIPEFIPILKGLRTIVSGAEAFPVSLYDTLRQLSPTVHIINGYGPSECTITCCAKELESSEKITIGGPTANTAFYVIDRFGNVLPPYACGELIICGELVGRGYVKLPEKTKAAFFTLRGLPAYHSGDVVRLNADGEVEFFGRKDNQVKLRGFRIELDEIEKSICTYPGVTQSKVIVRNNGTEDFLAAFFTADHEIDLSRLRDHLKAKLTYYMVPDAMMQLDAMPLTPSGKIDKKALPEIKREKKQAGKRAPKKSMEEQLCELFGSVLSSGEYYADDNFFEMGGTSLSASKVTMQLMSAGIKVEYQDIFDHPTPESLAAFIDAGKVAPHETATPGSAAKDTDDLTALLRHNAPEYAAEVTREPLGDVLLTGAVGFLGIHILNELLRSESGKIYCLVRRGKFPTPTARLKNILMYYFNATYDEEFERRLFVIDADITDDNLADTLADVPFDTLLNCAACVKHYAADDVIERINVHGVENLIRVARHRNARMIQISTTSVPGVHTEETYLRRLTMHENELFVIDDMDNKYCISKYHAELKMLEAMRGGLRGKIIRVGNLMGRHSDGEFQINFNTNAFLHALRGFATIGKCPVSHATDPMSFSPVDLTARAIVLLAGTNDAFTAFHADNRYGFDEMQLIAACNRCGVKITPVDDREYYADYYRMLGDETINGKLSGLVTNDRPDLHTVDTDNLFTASVLYHLGFSWPLPDDAYLERVIGSLLTLGYFDPDEREDF